MRDSQPNRRTFLRAAGLAAALTGVAGCTQRGGTAPADESPTTTGTATATPTDTATATPTDTPTATETATEEPTRTETTTEAPALEPLTAGGSSTVYPVMNTAAAYWNSNAAADDEEYWPHAEYGIETDQRLADYWAGLYGFPPGERSDPPFAVTVGLSHSGVGLEKVRDGRVDVGNASAPVEAAVPEWSATTHGRCVDHVVGVDAIQVVVSEAVRDDGVTELTGDELADVYRGEITNWSALDGPDRDIEVYGRVDGSGTATVFADVVLGEPGADTATTATFGQSQRLAFAIEQSDSAIGYLGTAFVGAEAIAPVGLTWDGTTYGPDENETGLGAAAYPLSRDLHAYTWDGTSEKEAAFLRMVLSDFGQATFVADNHYVALPDARRETQRATLPAPTSA